MKSTTFDSPNTPPAGRSPLADPSLGLAWSNPDAGAQALVINALRNGNFHLVLKAVIAHGMPFVREQFAAISDSLGEAACKDLLRKLANIDEGFARSRRDELAER